MTERFAELHHHSDDDGGGDLPLQIATFQTVEGAESALFRMFRAGIHRDQMSVAAPSGTEMNFPGVDEVKDPGKPAGGGATVGGAIGAAAGGVTTSAAVVALSVSGLALTGPLFAGVLSGVITGGLIGAMIGRGTAKDLADRYEQAVRQGRILVAVDPRHAEDLPAIRAAFHEAADGESR